MPRDVTFRNDEDSHPLNKSQRCVCPGAYFMQGGNIFDRDRRFLRPAPTLDWDRAYSEIFGDVGPDSPGAKYSQDYLLFTADGSFIGCEGNLSEAKREAAVKSLRPPAEEEARILKTERDQLLRELEEMRAERDNAVALAKAVQDDEPDPEPEPPAVTVAAPSAELVESPKPIWEMGFFELRNWATSIPGFPIPEGDGRELKKDYIVDWLKDNGYQTEEPAAEVA